MEVEAAGAGLSKLGSTSTWAGDESQSVSGRLSLVSALTIPDANDLVHKTLVGELSAERRDHVDLTIQYDHRIDRPVGEWSRRWGSERQFAPQSMQQVREPLQGRSLAQIGRS